MSEKKISHPVMPLWRENSSEGEETSETVVPDETAATETRAQIYVQQRNALLPISTRISSAEAADAERRIKNWLARRRRAVRQ